MRISSLFYCLGQGLKNIKRNKLFSLASISTIAACIFLIGIFYSILINFQHMISKAEEQLSITVFFDEGTDEAAIEEIGNQIKKRVEVERLEYTSAEQAWENFKNSYFTEENMDLAEGFADDNPLANSASYEIFINDIAMHDSLVSYLENLEGIRKVNAAKTVADTVGDFGTLAGVVSLAIIAVLFAVGVFLISNTVMIGISVRKEEIGIMKLIGATDLFVRLPFLVEGVIIGLVGASIPLAAIYFIYENIDKYLISEFQSLTTYVELLSTNEIFRVLIPVSLFIGAGIGFIGSMITVRKHLRV
ncbi:MAG: ABC transporter permease [Lachnospiraceae bacterium]|nr:ABC transporter permease [Lachnospiraceae bacterium]